MGAPYAEVIGDPVAYSRSPAIHKTWLSALGIQGDYLATPVRASALADHIAGRRADPDWRGCNVTMPHKQAILPLLDHVDAAAQRVGAVNCIFRGPEGLHGRSEEHTSELQSLMRISYAVFCLKKKKKHTHIQHINYS